MSSRAWVWLRAARPASQAYIALPLLLGQAMAYRQGARIDWWLLGAVQLFGVFDQLYIVLANDYADRATDRDNRTATPFSGGSRVLADGSLQPAQLRRAGAAAALCTLAVTFVIGVAFSRPWAPPLGALALLLLWAYSYPPLALSYRGGGELLQTLGVGLCLPLFGFYCQRGDLSGFSWPVLWVLLPTHLACAVATSLPDEPSDRRAGKRTASVLLGPRAARLAVFALNVASLGALSKQLDAFGLGPGPLAVLSAVPAFATGAFLVWPAAQPGSRAIVWQVALAVASTLSLVTILALGQVVL